MATLTVYLGPSASDPDEVVFTYATCTITYSVSSTDTQTKITVTKVSFNGSDGGLDLWTGTATFSYSISCAGTSLASGSISVKHNGTASRTFSVSKTITRAHTAGTATLSASSNASVKDTFGGTEYISGSKSTSVSVPALPSYTVSYNANGGTGEPSSQTKWHNETLTLSSSKPSKTNYAFYHWNTNSTNTGTTYNPGGSYIGNAALSLYAIWNPIIRFDANGGTTSSLPANQTKTYGQAMSLSSTVPTRPGYEFKRWNTSTSDPASTAYNKSASIAANDNLTKLLYAIWNPVISYDANGGSGAPNSAAKVFNGTYTVSSAVPARTGYEFSGWNTVKGGSGTSYAPGATVAESMNTTMTLYAQWTKVSDPPTISSLTVIRSNSSGTSDDTGTYCSVRAAWRVDTSIVSTNTGTVTGTIAPDGGSATAITFSSGASGTSGTAVALVPNCDTDTQYNITITVTDSFTSTSRTDVMTRAKFIFDFKAGGDALGIGSAAPSDGLEIGWETQFDEDVTMLKDLAVSGNVSINGGLTTPELTPTSYTSDVADAGSSWTMSSQQASVMGNIVSICLDLVPKSAISANTNNSSIALLKRQFRPKYIQGYSCTYGHGVVAQSGYVSLHTTTSISTSGHVYVGLTFLKA